MTDITRVVAAAEALIQPLRDAAWAGPIPCLVCDQAADAIAALRDAVQGLREAEPVFYWRPLQDGLYEGPHHAQSVHGRLMREAKPGEWHPLYATPPTTDAPAQWRPIETAPRGSGEDGPSNVTHPDYVAPPNLLLWTQEGMVVGYYDWYYHPGYGRGAEPGVSAWRDACGGEAYGPTHWMPLPAAPTQEGATK